MVKLYKGKLRGHYFVYQLTTNIILISGYVKVDFHSPYLTLVRPTQSCTSDNAFHPNISDLSSAASRVSSHVSSCPRRPSWMVSGQFFLGIPLPFLLPKSSS